MNFPHPASSSKKLGRSNIMSFNLFYIGVGIMPMRIAGDKNFLGALSEYLSKHNIRHQFVSIIDRPISSLSLLKDNIRFIYRPFHFVRKEHFYYSNDGKVVGYHHKHNAIVELIELSLTLIFSAFKLRKILNKKQIVHWQDLSLLVPLLRILFGKKTRIVASVLRYVSHNKVYNRLRARALNFADAVITSTEAAKKFLIRDGCNGSKIFIAPWGVGNVPKRRPHITNNKIHLLWSGYIQQIGFDDFRRSVMLARDVVKVRSDIEFSFSFKPESFNKYFLAFECPGVRIIKGDENFFNKIGQYDALFSPVSLSNTTLAPPLTWLEALANGLPIITTRTPGIEELLTEGKSAFIFEDYESLRNWLLQTSDGFDKLRSMRPEAYQEFARRFSIDTVGHKYLEIYKNLSKK